MKDEKEIRYADLFGGVGGFRLGIQRAWSSRQQSGRSQESLLQGGDSTTHETTWNNYPRCVFYSDNDKYAVQTYNKNFGENHEPTDIRTVEADSIPEIDMLCGGFPCQTFSIAGKRRGFEDTRGTLFFEIARIIKVKRPKIVFLENVKGLLNHDKGKTFSVIIQTLSELGYDVQWMVLNSKFFGVPQNRERVFIIGSIRGTSRPEILPFGRIHKEIDGERIIHGTITEAMGRQGSSKEYLDSLNKIQIAQQGCQAQRVFNPEGIAPTLRGLGGGQGAKTGLYMIRGRPKMPYEHGERELNYTRYDKTCPTLSQNCASGDQKNIVVQQIGTRLDSNSGTQPFQQDRVYDSEGVSPALQQGLPEGSHKIKIPQSQIVKGVDGVSSTINAHGGGQGAKTGLYAMRSYPRNQSRKENPNQERFQKMEMRKDGVTNTLSSVQKDNLWVKNMKIRRLTPIECERLQGFPDGWTEKGINEQGEEVLISDTQRYKMMGNAVTTNVITAIAKRLIRVT